MRVYKIEAQESYQWMDLVKYDPENDIFQNEGSLKSKWNITDYYIRSPKKKRGDFLGDSFRLGIRSEAAYALGFILEKLGELLPINIEQDEKAFVLNITTYLECLDFENTLMSVVINDELVYLPGPKVFSIKKYYTIPEDRHILLKKNKITTCIFMVRIGDRTFGPFCTDGFFPPEEEFYHIYQANNLKGLEFREVKLT